VIVLWFQIELLIFISNWVAALHCSWHWRNDYAHIICFRGSLPICPW